MLVLQDFEALTPNILCRTIETVEGGGFVVLLFKTMSNLKQLYHIAMDVHSRFRTESFGDVQPRFNERFILSLSLCNNCLVVDDELNILPITSLAKNIAPVGKEQSLQHKAAEELTKLKEELRSNALISPLINLAKTLDQAKAILTFIDILSEKNIRSTVSLTAGRGRVSRLPPYPYHALRASRRLSESE